MSSPPSEPGHHAAPAESVTPKHEQAYKKSTPSSQSKPSEWTPSRTPQKKPTSLLAEALATGRNAEQSTSSSGTSTTPAPLSSQEHHNGLNTDSVQPPESNMAIVTSPTDVGTGMDVGSSSTLSNLNLHDFNDSNSALTGMGYRQLLNTAKGRGTSLERTPKEKRVHEFTKAPSSTNPGDIGMSGSPAPIAPSASESISNNPPTEGVRAEYRYWRDRRPLMAAEKAWSIGNEGSKGGYGGQVEKSVSGVLAGVEHNNRSRKASHSMGFFKEGLPEDKTKKRDSKHRGRSKEGASLIKPFPENENERQEGDESAHAPPAEDASSSRHAARGHSSFEQPSGRASKHKLDQVGFEPTSQTMATASDEQRRTLPVQLLDEIRKHHNLTPGAGKGSSFSPSIPVTESERAKSAADAKLSKSSGEETNEDGAKPTHIRSADDDEDSGEEQIASALFVPHQTPHESPERSRRGSTSNATSRSDENELDITNPQQWLEEHEVPTDEVDDKYVAQENKNRPLPSPKIPKQKESLVETGSLGLRDEPTLESDSQDDGGYSTRDEESGVEDLDTTPTGSVKTGHTFPKSYGEQHIHDHQQKTQRPLEAIELIPYRHQVGGHTTMWRFSNRAICKELNNRENEFYEKVERDHPKLLKFLPRYIGVLNVTYAKQIRRRSTRKDNPEADADRKSLAQDGSPEAVVEKAAGATPSKENTFSGDRPEPTRVISQSLQSSSSAPIPTVTFADNGHIIPASFLQAHPHTAGSQHRLYSDNGSASLQQPPVQSQAPLPDTDFTFRPSLSDKHATSWGATTVNNRLRNEVFGEAFLGPIPIQRHRKPASQNRSLPSRRGPPNLRVSNSESSLKSAQQSDAAAKSQPAEESIRRKALKSAAARRTEQESLTSAEPSGSSQGGEPNDDDVDGEFDAKAGTSAPEPEISRTQDNPSGKRQRRYSSGGLRRRPSEVAENRGNLKYFEEADDAGYKGDVEEDVFAMDPEPPGGKGVSQSETKDQKEDTLNEAVKDSLAPTRSDAGSNAPGRVSPLARAPTLDFLGVPRPVNPKEAQTQPDSRVSYFLLLEDLSAGMERPCIMDLKMGTRQYGVDASEKKQKSQREKCAATTSKELGVRVCGLQVWDLKIQEYIFQDKYFGRELKAGREFQDALTRYLYDGIDYSSVLRKIPILLKKLSELEVLIRGLVGYRFYAASLLMFYEGAKPDKDESDSAATEKDVKDVKPVRPVKEISFKIADFANCVTKEDFASSARSCPPRHPNSPDRGFLRGLRSLKHYFLAIQEEIRDRDLPEAVRATKGDYSIDVFEGADDEGDISY
ncbi:Inositol hexakisphosphate kinase [Lachnellula suecica]|uniref:Kinase n=1 Tax=Lachnellula suecica TaxID=602035 RepID=A0A8T9BWZ3_9HELO|nr:Inositol hexakisphosphate kinase [Lachnellula suecica]